MPAPTDPSLLVRRSAGLLRNFPRGILAVRGKDRVRFLHNMVSHDIKGLPVGQAREACLLDRQGKIQFWALVHAHPEEFLLEMAPESVGPARAALEKYLVSEEVQMEDRSDRVRILALHGPAAPDILRRAFERVPGLILAPVPAASLCDCPGPAGSGIQTVARWDILRLPGFHLWTDPSSATALAERLLGEGRPLGLAEAGPESFETLRIEAGVPWPGKEIHSDVILNELGRDDLVSFTKGCYVGQEIVARIKHRAHPPRLLTGFLLEGKRLPPVPSPIHREGQPVGTVTSACLSPALDRVIALGFLKFETAQEGLQVQTPTGPMPARPTPLPFV